MPAVYIEQDKFDTAKEICEEALRVGKTTGACSLALSKLVFNQFDGY